jgi:hypothetical protein
MNGIGRQPNDTKNEINLSNERVTIGSEGLQAVIWAVTRCLYFAPFAHSVLLSFALQLQSQSDTDRTYLKSQICVNEEQSEKTWETQPHLFQVFNPMRFESDIHPFDNANHMSCPM